MKTNLKSQAFLIGTSKRLFNTALVAAVLSAGITSAAFADPPVAMAPPVGGTATQAPTETSVFNWTEIPANQEVPLNRAVFDQGGYQLYDTAGETIVVPFAKQNLYVMKFAVSPNDTLYFVKEGDTPVLYVPQDGYLENATVPGAKWYPFSAQFHPTTPIYLGIAPSYSDYVALGWYPSTVIYGGYCGTTSFFAGGLFLPTLGLTFFIGGHPYYGWHHFHDFIAVHPGPYHVRFFNAGIYHGNRGFAAAHSFHGFADVHGPAGFRPGSRSVAVAGHVFRGAGGGGAGFSHSGGGGGHIFSGSGHSFHGEGRPFGGSGHTFQGAGRAAGAGGHESGGGGHVFSGGHGGGDVHAGGGGHADGGGGRPGGGGGDHHHER